MEIRWLSSCAGCNDRYVCQSTTTLKTVKKNILQNFSKKDPRHVCHIYQSSLPPPPLCSLPLPTKYGFSYYSKVRNLWLKRDSCGEDHCSFYSFFRWSCSLGNHHPHPFVKDFIPSLCGTEQDNLQYSRR